MTFLRFRHVLSLLGLLSAIPFGCLSPKYASGQGEPYSQAKLAPLVTEGKTELQREKRS